MATQRKRNGKWVYCVKRAGLLDRLLNLTFADGKEGDEYQAGALSNALCVVHRAASYLHVLILPSGV